MNLLLRKYTMFFPIINDSLNKAHGNDCKCRFIKNRRFVSLKYRRKYTIEVYKYILSAIFYHQIHIYKPGKGKYEKGKVFYCNYIYRKPVSFYFCL